MREPAVVRSLETLVARASNLAHDGRAILGIVGCPGAGKSTLAEIATSWRSGSVGVSMDGFHLANAELDRLGRRGRKGAIDTFDAYGYLALLRRLIAEREVTVYAPRYDRLVHEPIAAAVAIDPSVRLIVTEGNYLLDRAEPWPAIRDRLAEVWYVELDEDVRRARLLARHVEYGKSEAAARRWLEEVDEVNARRIRASRGMADLIVDIAAIV